MSVGQIVFVFVVRAGNSSGCVLGEIPCDPGCKMALLGVFDAMNYSCDVFRIQRMSFLPSQTVSRRFPSSQSCAPSSRNGQSSNIIINNNLTTIAATTKTLMVMMHLRFPSIIHVTEASPKANTTTLRRPEPRPKKADNRLRTTNW